MLLKMYRETGKKDDFTLSNKSCEPYKSAHFFSFEEQETNYICKQSLAWKLSGTSKRC